MTWVAAAIIGGSVVSGYMGSEASQGAADTQAQSAREATAAQQAMFNQTQQNVAPWLQAGQGALSQLVSGTQPGGALMPTQYTPFTMDQFRSSPGYQFQMQQGQNALTNAASLSGGMNSNNLKGLLGYSQGLAGQDFQTQLNNYMQQFQLGNQGRQQEFANLSTLSQGGLGAGLQQGQIGANVGQSIGGNIIGAGNARAAGQIGSANALGQGISGAYNQYLQQQFMNPSNQAQNLYAPAIDSGASAAYQNYA